jgi:hypothetical protein
MRQGSREKRCSSRSRVGDTYRLFDSHAVPGGHISTLLIRHVHVRIRWHVPVLGSRRRGHNTCHWRSTTMLKVMLRVHTVCGCLCCLCLRRLLLGCYLLLLLIQIGCLLSECCVCLCCRLCDRIVQYGLGRKSTREPT